MLPEKPSEALPPADIRAVLHNAFYSNGFDNYGDGGGSGSGWSGGFDTGWGGSSPGWNHGGLPMSKGEKKAAANSAEYLWKSHAAS